MTESAAVMDFGPWQAKIVGPRFLGRFGYEVTVKNNWMEIRPSKWAWTHEGARRVARRRATRENRSDALRRNPEVVS